MLGIPHVWPYVELIKFFMAHIILVWLKVSNLWEDNFHSSLPPLHEFGVVSEQIHFAEITEHIDLAKTHKIKKGWI